MGFLVLYKSHHSPTFTYRRLSRRSRTPIADKHRNMSQTGCGKWKHLSIVAWQIIYVAVMVNRKQHTEFWRGNVC